MTKGTARGCAGSAEQTNREWSCRPSPICRYPSKHRKVRAGLISFIDYRPESALLWVVFMDADGACSTVPNAEVRMTYNWTLGRRPDERSPESPMRFPRHPAGAAA
jgi:hypothetical protein